MKGDNPFRGVDRWLFAFDEWLHRRGLIVVNTKAYHPWWGRFAKGYCNWWDRRIGGGMNEKKLPYFGEPWPSGICESGYRVPTPVGENCFSCGEPILENDQGDFIYYVDGDTRTVQKKPQHKECGLREVMGGIGHLEDHEKHCILNKDPDGGRTRRQSSLEVWDYIQRHGVPS